ncbi:HAD family hydrolase [Otariodibacter oris]|uniref:phosphoserine phosphatase n=1 Tax=Otariodibacter oris TaxID=1032623 RepID=A0A420XHA4_9PAST|nr:HAD family hydrolase [Otariodibacter oris]QGM81138.1 phosphorylcholine phosphatase [Otariodibacter oris]RKR72691.1 hypothetical protein DES31_0856 [Otariodibacter oris]
MKKLLPLFACLMLINTPTNAETNSSKSSEIMNNNDQMLNQNEQVKLNHWPKDKAEQLEKFIKDNAFQNKFATFDMDNTSYQYDLTESLLPYLEQHGVLTRDNLDPALKLIPFKDTDNYKESLYSYYVRLCEIDDLVCYPWIAQAFSGLELSELKKHVDTMIAEQKPIAVNYYDGDKIVDYTVNPPKIFPGMVELYNKLQQNGIEVYVITAANEELVRMVASDPKYGYNVKPENIYGVNVLLKNKFNDELATSHIQIKNGQYSNSENLKNMKFTSYLVNPMTWYEGKYATIVGWINQWEKPILVAGDTPISDGYMLLNGADVKNGGLRVWVDRRQKYTDQMQKWSKEASAKQTELKQEATADKNWLIVKPEELHSEK